MPKYDVHIFPVVRVKVTGVEANSQRAAIRKALRSINLEEAAVHPDDYAEDIVEYLVDEHGDRNHSRSQCYVDTIHFRSLFARNRSTQWIQLDGQALPMNLMAR